MQHPRGSQRAKAKKTSFFVTIYVEGLLQTPDFMKQRIMAASSTVSSVPTTATRGTLSRLVGVYTASSVSLSLSSSEPESVSIDPGVKGKDDEERDESDGGLGV
jgi:hypothetical protein